MSTVRRAWASVGALTASTFLGHASAAVMAIAAARGLSRGDRGTLALVLIVGSLGQGVSALGVPNAIAYWLAAEKCSIKGIGSFARAQAGRRAVLSIPVLGAMALPLITFTETRVLSMVLFAPWLVSGVLVTFIHYVYLGLGDIRSVARIRGLVMIVPNVAASFVAVITGRLDAVLGAYAAGAAVVALSSYRRFRTVTGWRGDEGELESEEERTLFRYGRRVFIGGLAQQLNGRADVLIVGLLLTSAQTGSYAVASSVGQLVMPVFLALSLLAFRRVAATRDSPDRSRVAMHQVAIAALVALASGIAGWLIVEQVLTFFYGGSYRSVSSVAKLLFVGSCLSGVTLVANECLRGLGRAGRSSVADSLGIASLLVLVVMVRPDEIRGLAVLSTLAYLVAFVAAVLLLCLGRGAFSPSAGSPFRDSA